MAWMELSNVSTTLALGSVAALMEDDDEAADVEAESEEE